MGSLSDYVGDSLWLSTFADAIERADDPAAREFHPGPGGDWIDTVTETPQSYRDAARRILDGLPPGTLDTGRKAWQELTRCDLGQFGHVLAMRILGSGVGLFDDLPTYARDLPGTQYRDVKALSDALPLLDTSAEFFAEWNPETGKVE